ncbi:unnamed protein product [Kuraishia capsulata CBS 1993]|uniref:L-2-hydroxyglutarate dehydrogenase, mitochondrial n=1 Tax=Kuraishia capsulata CBS 1993 TaxID=1382522 RepID=W6MN75_9ASCO|nr:uncharacterized protein KUCA_T00003692001 [Kuraishia capsulata CBS 1993]CDK27713.1 unnamed protein product [Kuraishia capsulata CBS 1993]
MLANARIRGIGCLKRGFCSSSTSLVDYSHAVIGGGVVGLAIAAELAKMESTSVILLEKHNEVGTETSSRNSEVIHAGLYYPPDSLKTKLCMQGKEMIYSEASKYGVELARCGKWIVAQDESQHEYLDSMHTKAQSLGIPTEFIDLKAASSIEPHVRARAAILNSPSTGIISAHSLMDFLQAEFQRHNGDLAVGSEVVGINYDKHQGEYTIKSRSEGEEIEISVNSVINSAGLYACQISNMVLPESRHVVPYYAKGNYFSLNSKIKVNRLVYPCPDKSVVQSLGTHLTIDLGGQIKFGPDLEWVDSPTDFGVSSTNIQQAYNAVVNYIPGIRQEDLAATYAGIRPKLAGPAESKFQDFIIRNEEGFPGFVNLLGIESPGLTSAMAIAKYVKRLI